MATTTKHSPNLKEKTMHDHDDHQVNPWFPNRYDAYKRGPFGLACPPGSSKTQQSFVKECDINTIMAKYLTTGQLPQGVGIGTYGDFSEAPDYTAAQLLIKRAGDQFAALPSNVRARFNHDPAAMLDFVMKPENLDEAHDLGLLSDEAAARNQAKRNQAKAAREAAQAASIKTETLK